VLIGLLIGAIAGAISGYYGGLIDIVLMRVVDIMFAFPQFLLLIILVTAMGRGLTTMFIAIGVTSWAGYARLVRGQILSAKNNDYVEAARCLGARNGRIIRKYILPNIVGPLIVAVSFGVPEAMMAESAMSLIGMGLRPPMPSWGNLISSGMMQMYGFPHLVLWPSLTFGTTLLAFTFVGDGLREVYGKE
jgi:peptide/nickel transport system permease protein